MAENEESEHIRLVRELSEDMTKLMDDMGLTPKEREVAGIMSAALLSQAKNMWRDIVEGGENVRADVQGAALAMAAGHRGIAARMRLDNQQ